MTLWASDSLGPRPKITSDESWRCRHLVYLAAPEPLAPPRGSDQIQTVSSPARPSEGGPVVRERIGSAGEGGGEG